jgi:hypothetical protein
VEGKARNGRFAEQVGASGDVNGDGFADILVCERGFRAGCGRVVAYYGSPAGLGTQPAWSLVGTDHPQEELTLLIADGIGDANNDDYDDAVIVWRYKAKETGAVSASRSNCLDS